MPSFDTWTTLFLLAAAQGLLAAVALLLTRKYANVYLAIILLLFAVTMTEYVLFWTRYQIWFPHFCSVSVPIPLLLGPLLWMYFKAVFEQKRIERSNLLHFVPFLVLVVLYSPLYIMSADLKRALFEQQVNFPVHPWIARVVPWVTILHLMGYLILNYRYISRQPEAGQVRQWANWINSCMMGYCLAYTSYFILVRFEFFDLSWDYHISLAMTVFIYLVALTGYLRPAIFQGFEWKDIPMIPKYKNSGLTDSALQSLFGRIDTLMQVEQLYKHADLSLDMLAIKANASKHHVSQAINTCGGGSFFDYVNQWRIEEAKRLLGTSSRSDMHVIEVAYAVGFNNKVSFNTAFKRATGMTPTEFRQRHHAASDSGEQAPKASGGV